MTNTFLIEQLSQGRWVALPPLETARSHPAVCDYEGRIYVFGGGGPDFTSLDSVVCFDPQRGAWETRAPLPTPRSGAVAFCMGEEIWVCGGGFKQADGTFRFLNRVDLYHPLEDTWRPGPALLQPHDYPAYARLDGRLYVLGGHHPEACLGGPKTDPGFAFCEALDTRAQAPAWQRLPDMPTPRFAASAFCRDGCIHVSGGVAFQDGAFDNFDLIETLDPARGIWSRAAFRLPWPAAGHGTAILSGVLVTFGGYSTDDIHDRMAAFDAPAGTWTPLPPMPQPRAAMGSAVLDGRLYLIGGWADDGRTPINQAVMFTID